MSNGDFPSAVLELKLVGELLGQFYVADYQRGYRWGDIEVGQLLSDIWENGDKNYSLQPVVVKRKGADQWELVDGQQRLTTLYLIFLYMYRTKLQNSAPPFSIIYETRERSADYLEELGGAGAVDDSNIDFFHMNRAYGHIKAWFEAHQHKQQHVANKFYGFLFERVRVIWYEAPQQLDSTTLFTRLNIGRIPLTNAELIKAMLLMKPRGGDGVDRAVEIANQWDGIERELRDPDLWAFATGAPVDSYPTRIEFLFELLAPEPSGKSRPRYQTFDHFRKLIASSSAQAVWNRVLDIHATIREWFEDRDLYHKIGFLVWAGESLRSLIEDASAKTKSAFQAGLDARIRKRLALTRSEIDDLEYADSKKCERILVLMNVETVRLLKDSSERYSFRAHRRQHWSIEHIHAQNAESLQTVEQWSAWLEQHRDALQDFPGIDATLREKVTKSIDSAIGSLDRESFPILARMVTEAFTLSGDERLASLKSTHSIGNLALLSGEANSVLSNAVFEVKRQRIIELDRAGEYIPICTRRVFLKYYTHSGSQQLHFWSTQDRMAYLEAMLQMIAPYFMPEEAK